MTGEQTTGEQTAGKRTKEERMKGGDWMKEESPSE